MQLLDSQHKWAACSVFSKNKREGARPFASCFANSLLATLFPRQPRTRSRRSGQKSADPCQCDPLYRLLRLASDLSQPRGGVAGMVTSPVEMSANVTSLRNIRTRYSSRKRRSQKGSESQPYVNDARHHSSLRSVTKQVYVHESES